MRTRAYTVLCVLVVIGLVTMAWGQSRVVAQREVESSLFLPVVTNGISQLPPGFLSGQGTTNSNGEVAFSESNVGGQIVVSVRDRSGDRLSGATVHFLSDGSEGRALVITPDQRVGWGTVQYPNNRKGSAPEDVVVEPFTVTLIVIIAAGSLATYHLIELSEDPPRIDLELGYARVCLTYNSFKSMAGVGLSVFALHTAAVHSAWIAAGEIGAEKFILEASPHILEATGVEWPWEGTWCFRQSSFLGMRWLTPETDTIQDAEFYARIRWDKANTDVDLHAYDSLGNHAYWNDMTGIPGGYLDRDDRDGFGPEIYRQVSYEGADYYTIHVHYYSDEGNGPTNVTIEIFDHEDRLIMSDAKWMYDDDWWDVYTIYPTSHPLRKEMLPRYEASKNRGGYSFLK